MAIIGCLPHYDVGTGNYSTFKYFSVYPNCYLTPYIANPVFLYSL